jgi:hypothetical protein
MGSFGAGQTGVASAPMARKTATRIIDVELWHAPRQNRGVNEIVRQDELHAAIEARKELGADLEPSLVDSFVERIEQRLSERTEESEQSLKRKREHQKEMVLGAMGISIPLLAIAAIFTGLAGVIVVCAALAVIAVASGR